MDVAIPHRGNPKYVSICEACAPLEGSVTPCEAKPFEWKNFMATGRWQ